MAKLPELQAADSRLDVLQAEVRRLRSGEPWAKEARAAALWRRRVADLEGRREAMEREVRRLDLERESEAAEADRTEQRLYGGSVTNLRDLEGLQKNLAGARARAGDLETRILEMMEAEDGVAAELKAAAGQLAAAEQALTRLRRDGGRRLADLESELPGLTERRARLATEIDPAAQAEYERVRERSQGIGVARLIGGCCEACAVAASPLVAARVRRSDRAYTCENCGRILVEV